MLVHAVIPASRANGPGLRSVVFAQGCNLNCPGCWNPRTHPFSGCEWSVEAVLAELLECHGRHPVEGVTFSGGEPMQQARELDQLIHGLRSALPALGVGMFTGYTEEELDAGRYYTWQQAGVEQRRALWRSIRGGLDFAVMGRYDREQPCDAPMRTSANQELRLFSGRHAEADFGVQSVEITIAAGGLTRTTGFPVLGSPA